MRFHDFELAAEANGIVSGSKDPKDKDDESAHWKFEDAGKNGKYIVNVKHNCRLIFDGKFDCVSGPKKDD